ncbi:M14 family zinc carboxypeptidase [Oceanimonas pelagia]|uniref:M14 family zinc carboxypeptidase n=1 Tax=Oceanimonas pelagia TaxID=3028314 RepID=A0AA50KM79_9GAMM|nr:M14 family zinc carboxypeptidase [Oceanimonas pelagia]WMC10395.1 M14 family zinc carboxypeptidase [Oceanimonas pelagia]
MRLLAILALWCSSLAWAAVIPPTPLEKAHFLVLPDSRDTGRYLAELDDRLEQARLVSLGNSAGGRSIDALLVSSSPAFLRSYRPEPDKATVLVLAAQHGNEPAGAEAVLQLARELAAGEHADLLKRLNLVLVALANPDGRDLSRRHNANNDNTNIDYVALNAGETRLLVNALHSFDPDLVYDAHESGIWKRVLTKQQGWLTDVEVQFEVGNNPNIDARLLDYGEHFLLPALLRRVSGAGVRAEAYRGEVTRLGQLVARGGLGITNLRNYAALQGRVSVLVESRLDNKAGRYATPRNIAERVRKQHLALLSLLQLAAEDSARLVSVSRQARHGWRSRAGDGRTLWMDVQFGLNADRPEVWLPLVRLVDGRREWHPFANHNTILTGEPVALPPAYAVTRERERMARWLSRHHIRFDTVRAPRMLAAERLQIETVLPQPASRPGVREKWRAEVASRPAVVRLGPGDLLVPTEQPLGPLAALMLDPRSSNSLYQEADWRWLAPGRFPVFPVWPSEPGAAGAAPDRRD